ncbi:ABC transporter ATP-binding protein [Streptomyces sp. NBC_00151]|uniref:ABC transporter ATP-binding protein n=1 Tax=Streptomyces sp. NBC_00151 TaxID=2975669 RepID=UPI002DD8BA9C|nr:ABC transporter ATP-binding protein [Streptomyces sp. NBC_00151]WRZ42815.1 ABC transporter ATP-binding protein [Streptomyces sp. NBC_00151]
MAVSEISIDPDAVLHVQGLQYAVRDRVLFGGLGLTVRTGESVAVIGPSGAGKSTLLSCVAGLIKPSSGTIRICGTNIVGVKQTRLASLRSRTIGMVFQSGELLPELSALDNVALAAMLSRVDTGDAYERAQRLLDELGVPAAETTEELSGGERQRTAVARALINSPALLLADEPTGALDAEGRDRTAELLFGLPRRYSCGVLVVTHDMSVAARADRLLRLENGVLVSARAHEAQVQ